MALLWVDVLMWSLKCNTKTFTLLPTSLGPSVPGVGKLNPPTACFINKGLKMWHIYTMEYYSAIKRNKIELFVVRWMDLESVIQSEVSQKEKNKYYMLTHIYGI